MNLVEVSEMEMLKSLNYPVAFVVEATAPAVYGYSGYQLGGRPWQKILLSVVFAGIMVLVWGRYLSPLGTGLKQP